jgi:hypothetical protein
MDKKIGDIEKGNCKKRGHNGSALLTIGEVVSFGCEL